MISFTRYPRTLAGAAVLLTSAAINFLVHGPGISLLAGSAVLVALAAYETVRPAATKPPVRVVSQFVHAAPGGGYYAAVVIDRKTIWGAYRSHRGMALQDLHRLLHEIEL